MAASQETLNILAVWPEKLYRRKQSPARRHYQRAIAARPDVNLHQTGPGFPDWNNGLPGVENIQRIMPDCQVVLSYKALGGCEAGAVVDPVAVSQRYLTVEMFNECWAGTHSDYGDQMHPGGGTVVEECRKSRLGLCVIHHECDRWRVQGVEEYGGKVVHIPHAAEPMFLEASRPWGERSGVLLTGSVGADHYPLRMRWRKLIQAGKIPGREFPRPPNYVHSPEQADQYVRQYAEALGSAKVVLGCSSVWKYPLARFPEVAMAGACHVADMPESAPPGYERMIWQIDPQWSDDDLVAFVESALEHGEPLAESGQAVAREFYTTACYAERFVRKVWDAINGSAA